MAINAILAAMGLKGAHGLGRQLKSGISGVAKNIAKYDKMKADAELYRKAKDTLYKYGNDDAKTAMLGSDEKEYAKNIANLKRVGINPKRIKFGEDPSNAKLTVNKPKIDEKLANKYGFGEANPVSRGFQTAQRQEEFAGGLDKRLKTASKKAAKPASAPIPSAMSKKGALGKMGVNKDSPSKVLSKMGLTEKDLSGPRQPKLKAGVSKGLARGFLNPPAAGSGAKPTPSGVVPPMPTEPKIPKI